MSNWHKINIQSMMYYSLLLLHAYINEEQTQSLHTSLTLIRKRTIYSTNIKSSLNFYATSYHWARY